MTAVTAAPSVPRRGRWWLAAALRVLPGRRVTPTVVVLIVVLTVLFGHGTATALGVTPHDPAGNWWRLATAGLAAPAPRWLLLYLPLTLLTLLPAERVMGSVRTAVVYLASSVAGFAVAFAVPPRQVLLLLSPALVDRAAVVDPTVPATGVLMAATFFLGPLWRRRIRVIGLSVVILFLVYGGAPADLYRVAAAAMGLILGAVLARRSLPPRWVRSSHVELRSLLAAVVAVTAVGPLIAIGSRSQIGPLAPLVTLVSDHVPALPTTVAGCVSAVGSPRCSNAVLMARLDGVGPVILSLIPLVILLVAAFGLLRGRRFALWMAIAVNLLLAGFAVAFDVVLPLAGAGFFAYFEGYGPARTISAIVSTAVPLAVAGLLFGYRRHFAVRAAPEVYRRYWLLVTVTLAVLSLSYLAGGLLFARGWSTPPGLLALLADLPERFIPAGYVRSDVAAFLPTDAPTRLLYHWVGPVFWVVALLGALRVFFRFSHQSADSGEQRMRALLHSVGGSSMGHMATWAPNSHWFSADGRQAVAFRLVNGVALTIGGPICTPKERPRALNDFARHCYEKGWQPCFYSLREKEYRRLFTRMGWATFRVGEEMVLNPAETAFVGRRFQSIRTAVNGAARLGITARWVRYRDLPPSQVLQVRDISEQWLADKGLPELEFTLGGLEELRDPEVRILLAVDQDDYVHGVTSWLPSYREGTVVGWTLDVMRRRADGYPAVMEFLIAAAVAQLKADGVPQLSLAAAPLAQSPESAAAGAQPVFDLLARLLEPAYGFRSLLAFKAKFRPEYLPLILALPDALALPVAARAIADAYLPGLTVSQRLRLLRQTVREGLRRRSALAGTESRSAPAETERGPVSPDRPS